jgi:hypothetical protein
MIRSVDQFACQQPVGWSVSCLPVGVSVCLSVCRCLLLSVYLCVCVSICVCLSIGLSVGGLSGGRSVYTVCLPFSRSVCLWSICLCACLRASVCLYLSVYLSFSLFVCLSVCCRSVGRSSVFLSCRSVTVCTKRAGSGGEDAESESGRLRTQERQVGLMNVELRTGAESRGLRARS